MSKDRPTHPDLHGAREQLNYELMMLFESPARLVELAKARPNDLVTRNALVESFAVHLRSIRDFLYGEGRKDDILAEHFISNWIAIRPPEPTEFVALRQRVDKEVAHLTRSRLGKDAKDLLWDFRTILTLIAPIIRAFEDGLPVEFQASARPRLKGIIAEETKPLYDSVFSPSSIHLGERDS